MNPTQIGVLTINFGEPDEPTQEKVTPFLERIFLQNSGLEPGQEAISRAKKLAENRAPGLIEEYESIGGSPLNKQAQYQSDLLEAELRSRGLDATTYEAYQFTEPSIISAVQKARADGVGHLIALPVYPICGRSTTVAALEAVRVALTKENWGPRYSAISGWHHHPGYRSFRAEHISGYLSEHNLDLNDPETLLYFSVHGTPIQFLNEGNRYDRYVEEHCKMVAAELGTSRFEVGFQNHTNRRIAWTQPDNENAIEARDETNLVIVPIAFMHEQSETLSELDLELRSFTEGLGKSFNRVPVPHDDERFVGFLATLVEDLLTGDLSTTPTVKDETLSLKQCRCAAIPGVYCANAGRDLPPSPYAVPNDR